MDAERFQCKVCFLIPSKEVYQCRNGDILCLNCCENLQQCPQCKVSIQGERKSRNRILEEILDELKLHCPFSYNGCNEEFYRKDLEEHQTSCKYWQAVPLCKLLNIPNCHFAVNLETSNSAVSTHLETVHGVKLLNVCDGGIATHTFKSFFDGRKELSCVQVKHDEGDENVVLVVGKVEERSVSWICLDLTRNNETGSQEQTQIEISSKETPGISWKLPAVPIMEAEEYFGRTLDKTHIPQQRKPRKQKFTNKNSHFTVRIKCTRRNNENTASSVIAKAGKRMLSCVSSFCALLSDILFVLVLIVLSILLLAFLEVSFNYIFFNCRLKFKPYSARFNTYRSRLEWEC